MFFSITYALLWLLAVVQGLVIFATIRQLTVVQRLSGTSHGRTGLPALGSDAPHFSAVDLISGKLRHSSEFKGRRTVLCLVSSDCSTCLQLLASLAHLGPQEAERLVVLCRGSDGGCRRPGDATLIPFPFLDADQLNVEELFKVNAFPTAIIIDEAWRIVGFRLPLDANDILESAMPRAPAGYASRQVA